MGTSKVNDANFQQEVLKSDKPVLVDFYADWRVPCTVFLPVVEEYANEKAATLKTVRLDVEESKALAAKYRIKCLPTLIVFRGGKIIGVTVGSRSKAELNSFVEAALAKPEGTDIDVTAADKKEMTAEEKKRAKKGLSSAIRFSAFLEGTMNAYTIGGGIAVAAAGISVFVSAIGIGAAAAGLYLTAIPALLYSKANKIAEETIQSGKQNISEEAHIGKFLIANPLANLSMSVARLAAGMALFSTGGFLAGITALTMMGFGGLDVLSNISASAKWISQKLPKRKPKEQAAPAAEAEAPAPAAPAPDAAPAAKLANAASQPEFNAAAEKTPAATPAPAAEEPKKPSAPTPPAAG